MQENLAAKALSPICDGKPVPTQDSRQRYAVALGKRISPRFEGNGSASFGQRRLVMTSAGAAG
jgi:hypothetical protein